MATPHQALELTARGRVVTALAAASLLGSWLSGDANVRLAAALLTAPLVVDFVRKPRRLFAVRLVLAPRRAVAGTPFREQVRLENHTGQPLRELLVTEERTRAQPALVPDLPATATVMVAMHCTSPERSHLLERVFALWTEWPLGLFRARAIAVVATDFVTEPRRVRLDHATVRTLAAPQPRQTTTADLDGDEFHALREHADHDDARAVHALRSAALGQLVRAVRRGRSPERVAVVLDLRRPPGRPLQLGRSRFEWSLGACAALLDHFAATATTVELHVLGSKTVRLEIRSARDRDVVATLLAEVAPSAHRPIESEAASRLQAGLGQCLWISAGGYAARDERARLQLHALLLDGERE